MKNERLDIVRFAPKGKDSFYDAVSANVGAYFETNFISPYANREMWIKTFVILLLSLVPYVFIITGMGAGSPWLFLGLWLLMGTGMSGIGTSIMHDANHGTYSANKRLNNFISHIIEAIGGCRVTWRIQHNILHYQKNELLKKQKISLRKALLQLTGARIFYYGYLLVLPFLFSGMSWYFVLVGFCVMHFTAGLFLSCIFQLAHIMETSAFASPVDPVGKRRMKDT